ncbi:MAG TPA: GDSL-type esterase/lipase family protein, partial [Candidatus Methanoperedens sp.]|nr:GDSL-type esterase/lipase family protein [Candidatus Methanoperedens sp.]
RDRARARRAALLLGGETLARWLGEKNADGPSLAVALAGVLTQALAFAGGIAALRARRITAPGPYPALRLAGAAAALAGAHLAGRGFSAFTGVVELLCAGAAIGLLLFALREAAALFLDALGSRRAVPGAAGPLLAIGAATIVAALLEALLAGIARLPPAPGAGPSARPVMPEALQRRETQMPGAREAYWWQGHLHVLDADRLRRTTPLPPKAPGVLRIAAFGDSLTYGEGVAAEEAWPSVLERELGGEYRVEVLNLGVSGSQSEDVLRFAERRLPQLEPDLVLYGVCLNDFLPSGRGQYDNNRAWSLTLPFGFHLEHGTRLGALVAAAYDRLLMRIGVRVDFYTDILRDFRGYQQRFARDVAALNRVVTARGLPPVVAMVLNQSPRRDGPGWRIGEMAAELMRAAGLAVLPADYIRANAGRTFAVSRWEGHPNAEAHRLFAGEFAAAVRRDPRLAGYRHGPRP